MKDFKARSSPEPEPTRWLHLRARLIGGFFLALLAAVFGRAVQLQVVKRDWLRGMAQGQYTEDLQIPARRGDIFDRRGSPLAQSVEVDSIAIDPTKLDASSDVARPLAKVLKLDLAELRTHLDTQKRFVWLKRQVTPAEFAAVKALEVPGVVFRKEPKRFYPQRELAAQVVGVVGTDGSGLEGLELAFQDELDGESEHVSGFHDAKGRMLLTQGAVDPSDKQGAAVSVTLDRQIQYFTERALGRAVDDSKALSGIAVVLDPRTGELLALANYPHFNPNVALHEANGALRDRAALDAFEPGSTMKSFVVAAGLEENAIKLTDTFNCENGKWTIGRNTIHDTHSHGLLTPAQILQVSSNIGAAKMAQVLGRDRLQAYYERFGFGEKTGLALPGEGKGSVPYPKADVTLATQAFGQGMTATAVQIASAYGALANGGVLMRPYLVSKVVDIDGTVLLENKPTEVRRVVSAKNAQAVISMLEGVVEKEGTAPRARMDEWRVAGKTGTAQKVDPVAHGYSEKRIASFVGVVPAEDPRLVILVVLDEPKTDVYGGVVAAPAFKEIAEASLPYLGIPSKAPVTPPAKVAAHPVAKRAIEAAIEPPVDTVSEAGEEGSGAEVPNVMGKPARDAVESLLAAGIEPRVSGSGRVVAQTPSAGARVEKGSRVTLELASRP